MFCFVPCWRNDGGLRIYYSKCKTIIRAHSLSVTDAAFSSYGLPSCGNGGQTLARTQVLNCSKELSNKRHLAVWQALEPVAITALGLPWGTPFVLEANQVCNHCFGHDNLFLFYAKNNSCAICLLCVCKYSKIESSNSNISLFIGYRIMPYHFKEKQKFSCKSCMLET